jgi:hypothetical protein
LRGTKQSGASCLPAGWFPAIRYIFYFLKKKVKGCRHYLPVGRQVRAKTVNQNQLTIKQ